VGAGCVDFPASRAASYKKRGMTDEAIAEKRRGALDSVAKRAPYKHIADKDGKWTVRDDVWVHFDRGTRGGIKKGALTVGFGSRDDRIGPEFGFGHVMGEALDSQVLLIKTCWGGKSLAIDFRSPSCGAPAFEIPVRKGRPAPEVGKYYRDMLAIVQAVLKDLKTHFPDYDGQGYEIVGFCWHQGWNDGCNEDFSKEYEKNLPPFILDVRKALGVPDLPFVIANSGFGGRKTHRGVVGRLQQYVQPGQAAAAKTVPNVACVETRDFYRPPEQSPGTGDIEHWFSNAESYYLIGDAMGRAMKKLLKK